MSGNTTLNGISASVTNNGIVDLSTSLRSILSSGSISGSSSATGITINGTGHFEDGILVKGKAQFNDDIIVNGRSISQSLVKIEERLKIVPDIKFDPELEKRWAALRELGERYRELEAEVREGEQAWAILNS